MNEEEIRQLVRDRYGEIARQSGSCCGSRQSCCGPAAADGPETSVAGEPYSSLAQAVGEKIGYSPEELGSVPEGANLGLGCGNPLALSYLEEGQTVLDLGSGAGFDCFLAARRVGESGRVIGVDMTHDMLRKARENAVQGGYRNVEFRLGEIENLPVADASVDLIISNCVVNLSVDKTRVFREAFRVLKPAGRLLISDIVLYGGLPEWLLRSATAYAGCVAGASLKEEYLDLIGRAGFAEIQVLRETPYGTDMVTGDPEFLPLATEWKLTGAEIESLGRSIASISVSAVKPVWKAERRQAFDPVQPFESSVE